MSMPQPNKIGWQLKSMGALYNDHLTLLDTITETNRDGTARYTWEEVDLTELQPFINNLPYWLYRLEVDWFEKFSNDPEFKCLTLDDSHWDFDDEVKWRYANHPSSGWWYKQHDDGRMQIHMHNGAVTWNVTKQVWETTQQDGYAKRTFIIKMEPGTPGPHNIIFEEGSNTVHLRGPWNTIAPAESGTMPLSTKPYNKDTCYCFGLLVPTMLIAVAVARDLSNHRLWMISGESLYQGKWRPMFGRRLIIGKPGDTRPKPVRIHIDNEAPWRD